MQYVYKFVTWDVPPLESLSNSKAYQFMEKLNRGEKLTREEKDWVVERTVYRGGVYRLYGWEFYFFHYMRSFLVRYSYGEWSCYRAFDKTSLRKVLSSVKEIHEIK